MPPRHALQIQVANIAKKGENNGSSSILRIQGNGCDDKLVSPLSSTSQRNPLCLIKLRSAQNIFQAPKKEQDVLLAR